MEVYDLNQRRVGIKKNGPHLDCAWLKGGLIRKEKPTKLHFLDFGCVQDSSLVRWCVFW